VATLLRKSTMFIAPRTPLPNARGAQPYGYAPVANQILGNVVL
jgi:hypothetical protein